MFPRVRVIFGMDAFRTLARVPIGVLGAMCFGIGVMAIVAALRADILVMQFASRTFGSRHHFGKSVR